MRLIDRLRANSVSNDLPPLDGFTTVWNSGNSGSLPAGQISLPLESDGTYNFEVDWGDGTRDTITSYNQSEVVHDYGVNDTFTVIISGTCHGWNFQNTTNGVPQRLVEIQKWGDLRLGNNESYFRGCSQMIVTATDLLDLTGTTSLYNCFRECDALTNVPNVMSWDVSNVTDFSLMFYHCSSLTELTGTGWTTTSALEFRHTFRDCNLLKIDNIAGIENIDTSNVTSLFYMFGNCGTNGGGGNISLDFSSWDVSNVTDMEYLFYRVNYVTSFNISGWTITSALQILVEMLYSADAWNEDLSGWNWSVYTGNINYAFNGNSLSTANYDALLIAWDNQLPGSGSGKSIRVEATYTSGGAGETARTNLIANGWSIMDNGGV